MEVWVAEVFDYYIEHPIMIGVFDQEAKAWSAIDIVIHNMLKVKPDTNVEARFVKYVTPVQLNGFTPASMDWCYSG